MNKLQKDLIALLTEDARLTKEKLAAMLDTDTAQIEKAVAELENSGAIVKYTAICNGETFDEEIVEALIEVKVTPRSGDGFDAIANEIAAHDEVQNLYLMSGAYDLAIIVRGKSLRSVSRFVSEKISTFETVISTATHFILKRYKVEGALIQKRNDGRISVQA